jgi:hypothetical protein
VHSPDSKELAIPRTESLFKPVLDRRNLRLAIVLGNEAPHGICPFAMAGLCHHCDIGLGEELRFDAATNLSRLGWLQKYYASVWPRLNHLVVYNSGSALNPLELTPAVLTALLDFARSLPELRLVSLESRESFITPCVVSRVAATLGCERELRIIIGIESADDTVRNQVLRKNMSRAGIERAVRNIATVRQRALASHDNAIALPGVAMNVIIGCPGTSAATSVIDAVQTAVYSVTLAETYGIPIDLNLHPYYPSKRGTLQFTNHSRPSVETTLEAVSSIAQSVGDRAVIFVGLEDEGHDQNPSGRAEYLARIIQTIDCFNRSGQSDALRRIPSASA